jgi:hypothetical protein
MESSSTIVEELLKEKDNSVSNIKTSEPSPNKSNPFSLTDSNSSNEIESEKVNIAKLISSDKLI